jgi:hypothetical protein
MMVRYIAKLRVGRPRVQRLTNVEKHRLAVSQQIVELQHRSAVGPCEWYVRHPVASG